ncbi:SIR2 family NAD-dependent protein deacylase (plasmid) [Coraliomargarita sp. W4R53]
MRHDLAQQTSYLRAALEQDKKPLGFLVGAGAPMSIRIDSKPLIPGIEQLTRSALQEVNGECGAALTKLLGHLPTKDQENLEALLNYIRALASLPGDIDVRGIPMHVLTDLDREICRVVRRHVNQALPSGDTPYFSLALWIGAVQRSIPVQVFTTNYDLLLEEALERQKVAYFDGFMGSREPVFDLQAIEEDTLPNRWTLLWKLHGSINWSQNDHGDVIRTRGDVDDDSSALVYPSHLKYEQSRRLPYLAMMDRLKAYLHQPGAILITSGFSFRDQHINEVIDQSLRANPTASVHALLYGPLVDYGEATALARELPNLLLLAEDAAVVGTSSGEWSSTDAGSDELVKCELGDFGSLGELLRAVTGDTANRDANDGS